MATKKTEGGDVFDSLESLTKPRDVAWSNWKAWGNQAGEKVSGYIRDVFSRPAEGVYKDQRGITLEQQDGKLINVGIKRLSFILNKTDGLRLGDPLTIELSELKKNGPGLADTKIFSFFGKNLPENEKNPTVLELDNEDQAKVETKVPEDETDTVPFE